MTIRQQGGIFGRNPKFNDVEANTVNTGSATIDSIAMDGSIIQIDANNAGQTSALNRILFKDTDTSTEIGQPLGQIDFWNNDSQNGVAARIQGISEWTSGISGIAMYTGSGGSPALAETLRLTWDGQVKATRGNFVVESGYGLDFSATSGTGTSELFDDYEEGTWTPALTFLFGSAGITYTNRYGFYTKVGNKVYVTATIQLSSKGTGSGNAYVNGLPFVSGNFSGNTHAFSLTSISNLTYTGQVDGRVYANAGFMYFGQTTEAGVNSNLTEANFANNTTVVLSGSYFV